MKKIIAFVMTGVVIVVFCFSTYLHDASAYALGSPPGANPAAVGRRLFDMLNKYRIEHGVKGLIWCNALATAATERSKDMITHDYFGHVTSSGENLFAFIRRTGGLPASAHVSENIVNSSGYLDPVDYMYNAWLKSPAHMVSVMDPIWTHAAIGGYINSSTQSIDEVHIFWQNTGNESPCTDSTAPTSVTIPPFTPTLTAAEAIETARTSSICTTGAYSVLPGATATYSTNKFWRLIQDVDNYWEVPLRVNNETICGGICWVIDPGDTGAKPYGISLSLACTPHANVSPTPTISVAPTPTPASVPGSCAQYKSSIPEGSVISANQSAGDPDIFIANNFCYKRLFLNPAIFNMYGHLTGGFSGVKQISAPARDSFITSGLFRNCEINDPKVYAIEATGEDAGTLHWVNVGGSEAVAQDPNFFQKIFCINNNEFNWYPKSSRAYTLLSQIPIYSRR